MTLACVGSVSVGVSVRSRHFSLFGSAKIGARTALMKGTAGRSFFVFASILARSKSEKCFKRAESYTETLASQATVTYVNPKSWTKVSPVEMVYDCTCQKCIKDVKHN